MQINLPDTALPLIQAKAAAAGFEGRVDAYIAHLIASDEPQDLGAPGDRSTIGKSVDKVDAMITAGYRSGPAAPMSEDDWRELHERVKQRSV